MVHAVVATGERSGHAANSGLRYSEAFRYHL